MTDEAQSAFDSDAARARAMQQRGAKLAERLDIDLSAYAITGRLVTVFTLMRNMAERGPLKDENLSMTAFLSLWSIWVGDAMEGKDVAAEVGIARSSFSELARRLEDRGLLSRHEDPSDGRVVLFRVTHAGEEAVTRAWPRLNSYMRIMTSCLEPGEQLKLAEQLRRLTDQLEQMEFEG